MNKIFNQYKYFLDENYEKMDIFEKRISSLIHEDFEKIKGLSSNQGKRGKKIADLIEKNRNNIKLKPENINLGLKEKVKRFRLKNIQIKNFRGFSEEVDIDLSKNFTFVYGPNGTGKSSFCEALEYSLLGSIEESLMKKIPLDEYIKNVYTDTSNDPVIYCSNEKDETEVLQENNEMFSFCFIERNRIEKFSRISADTPNLKQQRLSSLFGLDEWNNFVKNFNSEISNYLVDSNTDESLYTKEKITFEIDIEFLSSIDKQVSQYDDRVKKVLKNYHELKKISEFMNFAEGTSGENGRIQVLTDSIREKMQIKKESKEIISRLTEKSNSIIELNKKIISNVKELSEFKGKMSLKIFYQEIIDMKSSDKNNCPACHSVLYDENQHLCVPTDPYNDAQQYLSKLHKAISLEEAVKSDKTLFFKEVISLNKVMRTLLDLIKVIDYKSSNDFNFKGFSSFVEDLTTNNKSFSKELFEGFNVELVLIDEKIGLHNNKVDNVELDKKVLEEELLNLKKDKKEIEEIKMGYKILKKSETEKSAKLEEFKKKLDELKERSEMEVQENAINNEYRMAYKKLLIKLEEYSQQLPIQLVSSLEIKTLEIYNEINNNDLVGEQFESIKLPNNPNEKILISFNNNPKKKLDALLVLSEGHIRCLGLSILLAKIIHDDLPFIIFDDVVNAIDDEHRTTIAKLITSHEEIISKQCIITTHGNNYIETLENEFSSQSYIEKVSRVTFKKPIEQGKIHVDGTKTNNLLIKAQNYFEDYDFSNCLTCCRKSAENLSEQVWNTYFKFFRKPIKIKLDRKSSYAQAKDVFDVLISELSKSKVSAFENLVGLMKEVVEYDKKTHILWNIMNSGTHHSNRDFEFDSIQIYELLRLLNDINNEISIEINVNGSGVLMYKGERQVLQSKSEVLNL